MHNILIREIIPSDNAFLAAIIRLALEEFGANRPGTVYYDTTTDNLYDIFKKDGSIYYVAIAGDTILGGAGIFPSEALPEDTCELVKMYLLPRARGLGLGKKLIEQCLDFAKQKGYQKVYIESMPELTRAIQVYEKFGFRHISGPLGNTGHFGCNVWMLKELA